VARKESRQQRKHKQQQQQQQQHNKTARTGGASFARRGRYHSQHVVVTAIGAIFTIVRIGLTFLVVVQTLTVTVLQQK